MFTVLCTVNGIPRKARFPKLKDAETFLERHCRTQTVSIVDSRGDVVGVHEKTESAKKAKGPTGKQPEERKVSWILGRHDVYRLFKAKFPGSAVMPKPAHINCVSPFTVPAGNTRFDRRLFGVKGGVEIYVKG